MKVTYTYKQTRTLGERNKPQAHIRPLTKTNPGGEWAHISKRHHRKMILGVPPSHTERLGGSAHSPRCNFLRAHGVDPPPTDHMKRCMFLVQLERAGGWDGSVTRDMGWIHRTLTSTDPPPPPLYFRPPPQIREWSETGVVRLIIKIRWAVVRAGCGMGINHSPGSSFLLYTLRCFHLAIDKKETGSQKKSPPL